MTFNSLLEESISSIVYHTTGAHSLEKILKTNKFILSPLDKEDAKDIGVSEKYKYYMCVARSKINGFLLHYLEDMKYATVGSVVTFVLDGRKLSNNFHAKPYDFFSQDKIKKDKNLSKEDQKKQLSKTEEFEDRLVSKKSEILDAKKYILGIHILQAGEKVSTNMGFYTKTKSYAKNIPIYVYTEVQPFKLLNTKKAIKIK